MHFQVISGFRQLDFRGQVKMSLFLVTFDLVQEMSYVIKKNSNLHKLYLLIIKIHKLMNILIFFLSMIDLLKKRCKLK